LKPRKYCELDSKLLSSFINVVFESDLSSKEQLLQAVKQSLLEAEGWVFRRLQEIKTQSKEIQDAFYQGEKLYIAGQFHEATEYFKRVFELDSTNTEAHLYLGKAYLEQQEPEQAEKEFLEAVSIKSDLAKYHL